MNRQEALAKLHEITAGIDCDEEISANGWWETSTGADFGSERLRMLEDLVSDLASQD